ncbi:uncharacterized protein LOC144102629 [Amblyomma americanum]
MRRSSSQSKERKTNSSQSSAPLPLSSSSNERFETPELELASPGASYRLEDISSAAKYSAALVQAEGRTFREDLQDDVERQGPVASPDRAYGRGRSVTDASECHYGLNVPDGDTELAMQNDSLRCQGRQQVSPLELDDDSIAPTLSKALDLIDEGAASPLSVPLAQIETMDAADYKDIHDEVTVSSRSDKRRSVRASSPKGKDPHLSRLKNCELPTCTALLGQNIRMIGPESSRADSCGRQCEESSSPPKRRLTPLGWRLRKGGPTEDETSPTVASGEGHPEDSDATSSKSALTPCSPQQPPVEVEKASCSQSQTPSPPPTSAGHSPRRSWTSVLTKHARGRKMPKATTLFALLKRASNSPSREQPVLKNIGRLSSASDMNWACEEPQPESPSVGISAALVDPNSHKDRRDVYVHGEGDDTSLLQVQQVQLAADPYEVQTSKPPRLLRLKEKSFATRFRKSLKAMLIASAMILAGVLIGAAVLAQSVAFRQLRLMRLAEDLKQFCTGGAKPEEAGGCVAAVEQLSLAMDWSVNPCSSLDQFVCGHWSRWNSRRRSYKQESTANLTASIHETFQRVLHNLDLYSHEERIMAVFYNSCRPFIFRRNERIATAADVISALGLRHIAVTTNEPLVMAALVDFVVGSSLRSGLCSMISLSSRAGKVHVNMGQSLRSSLGDAHVVPFLREALAYMGLGDEALNPLLYVDVDVHSAVERVLNLERFVNVTAGVLGRRIFFGASFEEALNRALPNGVPVHTADTVVSARSLSEMRATMTAVAAKPHTAYVYTSLVLVAQVKNTCLY